MKIVNKNIYKIMFGMEFLNAGEVKDFDDKNIIKMLLAQPNVEEFVAVEDAKKIEEENKKLKEELEKVKKESKKESKKVK